MKADASEAMTGPRAVAIPEMAGASSAAREAMSCPARGRIGASAEMTCPAAVARGRRAGAIAWNASASAPPTTWSTWDRTGRTGVRAPRRVCPRVDRIGNSGPMPWSSAVTN